MSSKDTRRPSDLWRWLLALGLLLLTFYPTLRWLLLTWRGDPSYSHGLLVPPISAILAWRIERGARRAIESPAAPPRGDALGLAMLLVGLTLHLLSFVRQGYLLSALGLILALGGLVALLGDIAMLRRQLFPLSYLLFMIPLPWLAAMATPLGRTMAALAAGLVCLLGIGATSTGARLELADSSFMIGAPCSGVNSLVALTALACLYAFLLRGALWRRSLIVALAIPLALLANLVRLLALIVAAKLMGPQVALGWFHTWMGAAEILLALGLLLLVGRGLGCNELRSDI
jgi:exosortase